MGRIPVLIAWWQQFIKVEKELQELAVASTVVSDRGERTEMISRTLCATRHKGNDDDDNDNDDDDNDNDDDDLPFLLFQQWLCQLRQTIMDG